MSVLAFCSQGSKVTIPLIHPEAVKLRGLPNVFLEMCDPILEQ